MLDIHSLTGCNCQKMPIKGLGEAPTAKDICDTRSPYYNKQMCELQSSIEYTPTKDELCDTKGKYYHKERCEVETKCLELSKEDCEKIRFELAKKMSDAELNGQLKRYAHYVIGGILLVGGIVYYAYANSQKKAEAQTKPLKGLDYFTDKAQERQPKESLHNLVEKSKPRTSKYNLTNGTF